MSTESGGNAEHIRQLLAQEQASLQPVEQASEAILSGTDKNRKRNLLAKMEAFSSDITDELEGPNEIPARQDLNTPDDKINEEKTLRSKGRILGMLLEQVIAKLRGNTKFGEEEMLMPKMEGVSKYVFNKMLERIKLDTLNIEVLPYVFALLVKAMKNEISGKNIFDILSRAKLLKVASYNKQLFDTLLSIIYDAAVEEGNVEVKKATNWRNDLVLLQSQSNPDAIAQRRGMDPMDMMGGEKLSREKVEQIDKKIRAIVNKINAKYPGLGNYYIEFISNGADDFETLYGSERRAEMEQINSDASFLATIPEMSSIADDLNQKGYFQGLLQAARYNGMIDEAEEVMRLINPNMIFQNLITPEGMWNHFGADDFKRKMGEFINGLFRNALSNPYADFRENFNPGMEGMILNQTRTYIFKLASDSLLPNAYEDLLRRRRDDPGSPDDVKAYLTEDKIQELKEAYRRAFRSYFNDLGREINQQYRLTELSHNTRRQSEVDSKQRQEYHDQFKLSEMRNILRGKPLLQEAEWVYPLSHAWRAAENNNFIPDGYQDPQEVIDPVTGLKTQENVDLRRFMRNMQRMIHRVRQYKLRERGAMLQQLQELRQQGKTKEASELQDRIARFYIDRENDIPESEFTTVVPIAEFFNRILTDEENMYMGRTLVYGSAKALEDRSQPNFFASGWRQGEAARASSEFFWSVGRGRHYVESPVANMQAATWVDDMQKAYDEQAPRILPMGVQTMFSVKREWDKMVDEVRKGQPMDEKTIQKRLENSFYDTHKSMRQHYEELLFVQNWKYEGGYGYTQLKIHFEEVAGKSWGAATREEQDAYIEKFAGFGTKFAFLKEHAGGDKAAYLARVWGMDPDSSEFAARLGQYNGLEKSRSFGDSLKLTLGLEGATKKKDKFQRFIPVVLRRKGGRDHHLKVSNSEFNSIRLEAERAKLSYEALLKQPVVFLTHMVQMMPEIADGYVQVRDKNSGNAVEIPAAQFYLDFDIENKYAISDGQRTQLQKTHNEVRYMFGEQNIPHISKMMSFFQDAYTEFADSGEPPLRGKSRAFDALFSYGNAASTIARLEGTEILPEYIISDQEIAEYRANPGNFSEEDRIDIEDRIKVRKLLFHSENAIITHLKSYVESEGMENVFGDNGVPVSGDMRLGDSGGFFQRFVKTWYGIKNIQYDPLFYRSTYGVITPYPQSNDVGKRREGDKGVLQETILGNREKFEGAVVNFVNGEGGEEDSAINAVFDAQAELFNTLWKVDKGKAQHAMKIYTIDFFKYSKGAAMGLPFPFDMFMSFILGKQGSTAKHDLGMSNLRSLNDDQMTDYIERMVLNDYITKEQAQEIRIIMQLEKERFVMTSMVPTLAIAIIVITLTKFFQEAVKENSTSG